jgi:hypothetical protein
MKESDKNRAILAEAVARAWREPAYLSQLRQNPKATLQKAGASIPAGMDVVLLENTPTVINAILPPKGDMARYEARLQKAVKMLADLPEDIAVHLHRDSASRAYIVIPEAPAHGGELTDAQLEQVVGGKGGSKPAPPKVGTVNVTNAVNATNVATVAEGVTGAVAVEEAAVATTVAGVAEVAGAVAAVVVPCFIS